MSTARAKARFSRTISAEDAAAAIELVQYAIFRKVLDKKDKKKRNRNEDDDEMEVDEEENNKGEQRPKRRRNTQVASPVLFCPQIKENQIFTKTYCII